MKSEIYLSARVKDGGHAEVNIKGPANKVLVLLEEEAVQVFRELNNEGCPNTVEVMCLFFKKVAERVVGDDP